MLSGMYYVIETSFQNIFIILVVRVKSNVWFVWTNHILYFFLTHCFILIAANGQTDCLLMMLQRDEKDDIFDLMDIHGQ